MSQFISRVRLAVVISLIAISVVFFGVHNYQKCRTHKNIVTIKGASLQGIVSGGQQVRSELGYYDCHDILRGDLVEYAYGQALDAPVVKIVKGIPGDRWRVYAQKNGLSVIEVNGELLATSDGSLYELDERRGRLLNLYVNDYNGVIPKDAYLILGNLPNGTIDSSAFGLVAKTDILGRVFILD
jgi:signal peptidase I